MNRERQIPRAIVPASSAMRTMNDRTLLALAIAVGCVAANAGAAGLAVALRLAPEDFAHVRRTPTLLSPDRRLTLASIVGRLVHGVPIARELRHRIMATVATRPARLPIRTPPPSTSRAVERGRS